MATTVTYIVKADGDPKLKIGADSDHFGPWVKSGLRIASFKVLKSASPAYAVNSPDYGDGDTVVIQLDGAITTQLTLCHKINATALIALTPGTSTNPPGITLSTGVVTTAVDLEFFIVYSVETGTL